MSIDQEALLVEQAQQGNQAAFAEIYARHHGAIYAYLYCRVHDVHAAEDLAGEVFLRVVEKIGAFRYRGRPILAWLYTIARNLLIDFQRQQAKAGTVPLAEHLTVGEVNPATAAERRSNQDCLFRSLQQLTEEQQRVILHRLLEDRSTAEVAALMGKSETAIKALQHRALASLRRVMLKERCYEP